MTQPTPRTAAETLRLRLLSQLPSDYHPMLDDLILEVRRNLLAQAASPEALDVEGLIRSMDRIKRTPHKTIRDVRPEDMGFDVGVAAAQDFIHSALASTPKEPTPSGEPR